MVDFTQVPVGTGTHCSPGVNNMSKEHKNKRDVKKKPAMTPKEKKAAKLVKKDTRNILGN